MTSCLVLSHEKNVMRKKEKENRDAKHQFRRILFFVIFCHFVALKPQSHIHGFGPGRATVHPDLASR